MDDLATLVLSVPEGDWTPQNIANVLNAYARVEYRHEAVVRRMCKELTKLDSASLDIQTISLSFHAIATLHVADTPVIRKLSSALSTFPPGQSSPQSVSNIAWSYAVMRPFMLLAGNMISIGENKTDQTILQWIWDAVAANLPQMDKNSLSQLHQLLMTCQLDGTPLPPKIDTSVVSAGRRAFQDHAEALQMVSTLQNDVAKTLKHMGYEIKEEIIDDKTGYSLDIYIPDDDVVVEVDGPTHYCHNSKQPLGRTVLKHRHLRNNGYAVVKVPYFSWRVNVMPDQIDVLDGENVGESCVTDLDAKMAYLKHNIELAVENARLEKEGRRE